MAGEVLIAEPGVEELLGGVVIEPVRRFGVMDVYRRRNHRQWGLPKYVVIHRQTGSHLEDFRRQRGAFKWAHDNQEG